jgi:hypothetical protein
LQQKGNLHRWGVDQTSLAKSLRASFTSLSTENGKRQHGSAYAVETNATRFVGIWNALCHDLGVKGLADISCLVPALAISFRNFCHVCYVENLAV